MKIGGGGGFSREVGGRAHGRAAAGCAGEGATSTRVRRDEETNGCRGSATAVRLPSRVPWLRGRGCNQRAYDVTTYDPAQRARRPRGRDGRQVGRALAVH